MTVRTVLGDVEELGITYAHEHLFMTGGWPVRNEPDYRLDSLDAAVVEVTEAQRLGLSAVVEMTPLGFGRSPSLMKELAERTGLHVIAVTGFHKSGYYSDAHWMHRYSVDEITELLVAEIDQGMDEYGLVGPLVRRSSARAGAIKIATSYHSFGRGVARLVGAVAAAARRTGVPVVTHCDKGTMGHELLDALASEGVAADRVVLGHIDHNPDAGYLASLAERGAYLAFDRPGRVKYGPDSAIVTLVAELAERELGDRVLFGMDLARRSYWPSLGGGPGLTYLLERFVPRLEAAGLGEVAKAALIGNPRAAFALRR
ncbi:phosphotriesterase family protein [Nonomuraea sp. CA-143628]|uniref:phosphotriesterase family protein n=1 Tax=Nonomuraea sp. CA-143628 TaxID=3239997 RepID=UPI003D8A7CA7